MSTCSQDSCVSPPTVYSIELFFSPVETRVKIPTRQTKLQNLEKKIRGVPRLFLSILYRDSVKILTGRQNCKIDVQNLEKKMRGVPRPFLSIFI
jgi:hypothetical protein